MIIFMMYSDYDLISALLKGDAKMSAETRLRIWSSTNNTDRDAHDIIDNTEIRENMMEVVKIAAEGVALQDIRTNYDNMSLFKTFVNLCLIHFTTSISWRYKACDSVISDIFTVTDEALCILFLKNNADDYVRVYQKLIGRNQDLNILKLIMFRKNSRDGTEKQSNGSMKL